MKTKKIYVCSPLSGDIETNIEKAKGYCEYIVKICGAIPIAPHIYFTQFLDDNNPEEREFGLKTGLELLSECDELYYFGNVISKGMKTEICYAVEHKIPVLYIPDCEHEEYSRPKIHNEEMMFNV